MTWFKVDDSFHSHSKVLATEPAALGLWVVAGSWCSSEANDGFVPDYVPARLLPGGAELAEKLVTSKLWRRTKGGYLFHDWGDFNPLSGEVRADREAARERMRVLRRRRKEQGDTADQEEDCSPEHPPNTARTSPEVRDPRPDPTRSSPNGELPPDGFDEFWTAYPRRKNSSKADARKAYIRALKAGADPTTILAGANTYARDRNGHDQQYTAHASTWLNGKRWETQHDEPAPNGSRGWWDN